MKTHRLLQLLDETLTDTQITDDLSRVLRSGSTNDHAAIEIQGSKVDIPLNVSSRVVTKAVFKDRYNSGFGTLRAQVALGEVIDHADGDVIPKYCFTTLYYDEDCNLISTDFHKQLR